MLSSTESMRRCWITSPRLPMSWMSSRNSAGLHGQHVGLALPVPVPWGEVRDGQFQAIGGFDVREGREHLQQLGHLVELGEPALEFEPVTADY